MQKSYKMKVRKILAAISAIALLFTAVIVNAQQGAFYTGKYKNMFKEVLGKTDAEINAKVEAAFQHFFYGGSNDKLYYEVGSDMAYMLDVANNDVRSEGMSYGLMICVQLDKQEEFNKLWRWTKRYMQHSGGTLDGFFRWQLNTNGNTIDQNPAPDGEAYFITALFFAAHRWGNDGEFNYEAEAQSTIQKVQTGTGGQNLLFNAGNAIITFGPNGGSYDFTDPSYNLPGFFELWAKWSTSNTSFWQRTPGAARKLLRDASHPTSGLSTDYSQFNGQPHAPSFNADANKFMYDAWRTIMNIGMDWHWFQADPEQPVIAKRYLNFFKNQGSGYKNHYNWDGSNAHGDHSPGLVACNAAACLAVDDKTLTEPFLSELWSIGLPSGTYRYYDGMLYMLGFLNTSGNFRIYGPGGQGSSPDISIESPTFSDNFNAPATVAIEATVSTPGGETVTSVDFYNGTELIGSDNSAPYTYSWNDVSAGSYEIIAVAHINGGDDVTSSAVPVVVRAPALLGEILVNAYGVVGDETLELEVDGEIIETWTLGTAAQDFTVSNVNVNGVIRVNYTNDDGADRDAIIDYIEVAGVRYETEDQEANTGTYGNNQCGGAMGETLHCSGYVEYATNPVVDECPNDPNKVLPGDCGCGVVDTDTDSDGTADCIDECPNDPNKIAPGDCGCGKQEGTCDQEPIVLKAGWNLIGCPLDGETLLEDALSSIWEHVETVKDMDRFYQSAQDPTFNLLKTLEWSKGYFIKVTQDCELNWIAQ